MNAYIEISNIISELIGWIWLAILYSVEMVAYNSIQYVK